MLCGCSPLSIIVVTTVFSYCHVRSFAMIIRSSFHLISRNEANVYEGIGRGNTTSFLPSSFVPSFVLLLLLSEVGGRMGVEVVIR